MSRAPSLRDTLRTVEDALTEERQLLAANAARWDAARAASSRKARPISRVATQMLQPARRTPRALCRF